jgi:hypothetical protein
VSTSREKSSSLVGGAQNRGASSLLLGCYSNALQIAEIIARADGQLYLTENSRLFMVSTFQ